MYFKFKPRKLSFRQILHKKNVYVIDYQIGCKKKLCKFIEALHISFQDKSVSKILITYKERSKKAEIKNLSYTF